MPSYPNIVWERMACGTGYPRALPVHVEPRGDEPEVGGILGTNKSNDYVAKATGLITGAFGFFDVSGVIAETGVGRYYNPNTGLENGILGSNEYSIQLNTNELETTSACAGHSSHTSCYVWQQFVYATDYQFQGFASVFMQYWLFGYGPNCDTAKGWNQSGNNC